MKHLLTLFLVGVLAACGGSSSPLLISFSPPSLSLAMQVGQSASTGFSFTNTSKQSLSYTLGVPSTADWLQVSSGASGTVNANATQAVMLSVTCPAAPSNLSTKLSVKAGGLSKDLALSLSCTTNPPPPSTITSVSVTPNSAMLNAGQTLSLTALVQGSGTFDPSVTWASSAACKASVDANGTVTGISGGGVTLTITATSKADPSQSAAATLTINGPVSIPIGPGGGC